MNLDEPFSDEPEPMPLTRRKKRPPMRMILDRGDLAGALAIAFRAPVTK